MGSSVEEAVVRKSVRVRASVERAWSVFVEQMETWWPATHHIAAAGFELIVVEPRAGGRWYERDAEGRQCEWGKVLGWDPPRSVRFSWQVGPKPGSEEWGYDPDMSRASEVEFRFSEDSDGVTLVELEHSKLERHGMGAEKLRALFEGPGAWVDILAQYVRVVDAGVRGAADSGEAAEEGA
ncbi:MAG TPA: SRPBCC family protein [Terracidiphilus sp.]